MSDLPADSFWRRSRALRWAVGVGAGVVAALTLVLLFLLAQATGWLATLWLSGAAPSLAASGLQWLATVLLFPLASFLVEHFRDADVRFR